MDRNRARAGLLTGATVLLVAATATPADAPLRAARWLAPGVPITELASQPAECVVGRGQTIAIGRAAFRTPLLLGGQAARAGLSCASCHRNGRGNPHFFLPGLSGAAGTADVTSSLMSSHRGDGRFNPKPIPDLAGPETSRKVSRDPANRSLETFIRGVIVEEFDGIEPPSGIVAGLAAYVRALSPAACPAAASEAISLETYLADARAALTAAAGAWRAGDPATARLMVASARSSLALIDERYARHATMAVRNADLELAGLERAIDRGANDVPIRIAAWRAGMAEWVPALKRDEPRSLFNPTRLGGV